MYVKESLHICQEWYSSYGFCIFYLALVPPRISESSLRRNGKIRDYTIPFLCLEALPKPKLKQNSVEHREKLSRASDLIRSASKHLYKDCTRLHLFTRLFKSSLSFQRSAVIKMQIPAGGCVYTSLRSAMINSPGRPSSLFTSHLSQCSTHK